MDLLDKWYSTYSLKEAKLNESQTYSNFEEFKTKKFNNDNQKALDNIDTDIRITKCVKKIDFDDCEDEGIVECITAAECEYHGKTFVLVLPVIASAEYTQTSYHAATYESPAEATGYYSISPDEIEIGEWDYTFSSAERFKQAYREWHKGNKPFATVMNEWQDVKEVYTKDNDVILTDSVYEFFMDDKEFIDNYLNVVDKGFATDFGDELDIAKDKAKKAAFENQLDAFLGK